MMESNTDIGGHSAAPSQQAPHHGLRRMQGAAEDLVRWWQHELVEMVPPGWRQWATSRLRVEASASEMLVFLPPQQQPIDRIDLSGAPGAAAQGAMSRCELVLAGELGLAVPITLPAAAEENLRSVIAFSLDRYTPFSEEEVYYGVRITKRDRRNGKLELMLYVVPRETLARLTRHLATLGLTATVVDIVDSQQEPPTRAGINLLPAESGQLPATRVRLNGMLTLVALLLLLAVLLIPLYQRHETIRAMELELQTLHLPVQEAQRLREDVRRRSETLRIILQRRNATPPALELLRELTRLTPDEAWAGQVEIRNGRLRLTGEAVAGSELMQALTSSSYFADPRFEAPLTQNPKSSRERFVISLAIKERSDEP